jgi:hypothetical protein
MTNDRIAEAVEPRPGRWTHHGINEKEDGLDADVQRMVQEA